MVALIFDEMVRREMTWGSILNSLDWQLWHTIWRGAQEM
jgi:hypothetical protein